MASKAVVPGSGQRRQWGTALAALRKLLADGNNTAQVFRIMRALNVGVARRNYDRLLATANGGHIAYARVELSRRLTDRGFIESFATGTVGAAYRGFLDATGYSADGLAEVSRLGDNSRDIEHPYAWFGRRERDAHDIWHVLTGYKADEQLGEACLVAFSYAQTRGLGWAAIAVGATIKALRYPDGRAFARAVWEGYRHGRAAKWLSGEDYELLLAEPIDAARARLKIAAPARYRIAQAGLAARGTMPARLEPYPG